MKFRSEDLGMYENVVHVHPYNGKPEDYTSLAVAYRPMLYNLAKGAKIPLDYQDDAVQRILLRFWQRGGLENYDPAMQHEGPDGKMRTSKFQTMIRKYAALCMRAERDRVLKANQLNCVGSTADVDFLVGGLSEPDPMDETVEQETVSVWVKSAAQALEEEGRKDLIPLLELCWEKAQTGQVITRADVAEALGCALWKATAHLAEFRAVLVEIGFGPDSFGE